jgi:arylsulfatase B
MGPSFIETRYATAVVRDQFRRWWSTRRGPKFAYVAFSAAHSPFHIPPRALLPHPPSPLGVSETRHEFESMVTSVDTALGQLASVVDLRNTYVIVTADNGTPPTAASPRQQANKLKTTVYEGGVNVPFLIAGPGIRPGVRDALISLVDVLPTCAELIGVAVPPGLDGRSLVPLLDDPAATVRDHVFVAQEDRNGLLTFRHRAVIQPRWKVRRVNGLEQFYDLEQDPGELQPLDPATLDPAVVQSLRDEMAAYIARGF